MILEYIIANAVIGGIATGLYFVIKRLKKPVLCKSCKHLVRVGGGGVWKYECTGNTRTLCTREFDKPPRYCRYYKSLENEDDGESKGGEEFWRDYRRY